MYTIWIHIDSVTDACITYVWGWPIEKAMEENKHERELWNMETVVRTGMFRRVSGFLLGLFFDHGDGDSKFLRYVRIYENIVAFRSVARQRPLNKQRMLVGSGPQTTDE
jgi:hypothetical protein